MNDAAFDPELWSTRIEASIHVPGATFARAAPGGTEGRCFAFAVFHDVATIQADPAMMDVYLKRFAAAMTEVVREAVTEAATRAVTCSIVDMECARSGRDFGESLIRGRIVFRPVPMDFRRYAVPRPLWADDVDRSFPTPMPIEDRR